jgi:CxxC motif-containing protein (DUF1111 family)
LLGLAALVGAAQAAPPDVELGRILFERNWVAAPSSIGSDDGLGPLFDAPSCVACHAGGGPGRVGAVGRGSVVRVGNARGTPGTKYGSQFQVSALPGLPAEGRISIRPRSEAGLRVFSVGALSLGYGTMAAETKAALRRAPSLRGIGLLASVPVTEIRRRADPTDRNHDGISGRRGLGRFGWKATQPTVTDQVEIALMRDMGLSTTAFPDPWGDCTEYQPACRAGPHGARAGEVEVPDQLRDMIVAFLRALPPPAPLNTASRGFTAFNAAGCAQCHAALRGADGDIVAAYTDLLLHDLGKPLDDGIVEGNAAGAEWRTPPLWDTAANMRAGGLMHDGRARTVEEAIAWHGGEAAAARARFNALPKPDRRALVDFLLGR